MKIYIDFDDVICETAKNFTVLAGRLFGIGLPYREVRFFDLQKAFGISREQYERLMEEGHKSETLLSYRETPGASRVINKWIDEGHEVSVITGRPFDVYEPSRLWLDGHGLSRAPLFFVDKYGRGNARKDFPFGMTLEELYRLSFDIAVEDSPAAFGHLLHFEACRVAVFDRPWNREAEFPSDRFVRCKNWAGIEKTVQGWLSEE